MTKQIFLLGFMGSGKTRIGKKLAGKLGLTFFDLDKYIEKKTGYKIPEIFSTIGEDAFRQVEKEALHSIVGENDDFLLSTGGGTPCFYNNMSYMNKKGLTIYLRYNPGMLHSRLKKAKKSRPLIDGMDEGELLAFIKKKLKEREKYYLKAKKSVQSDNLQVETLEEEVKRFYS